jgi:arylsulfatase A-like enzyme/Flp pilus assembly protein TadD
MTTSGLRFKRRFLLAALGIGGAVLADCSPDWSGPRPRSVLLVSIDTLRADALGCYGAAGARTGTLDRMATEGARFRTVIAPAPVTLPSHAAMLTGLSPWRLGIFHNGIYRLAPRFESLAERLSAEGFETAAFIGGYPLSADSGLDQGFAHYDDSMPFDDVAKYHNPERSAEEVTDAFLAWLDGRPDRTRPFFAFVHYYDVHAPYAPPAAYAGAGTNDAEQLGAYGGEVAYVDDQIQRLVDLLQAEGTLDDTLVIVTADHGEGLMEHGEPTHSIFLYDEAVRVPLIMRYPPALPGGLEVDEVVGLADVAPTVLQALGLPADRPLDGRSLWALARGTERGGGGEALSESQVGRLDHGWSRLRSIRTPKWKYIDAPRPELYAIPGDPGETRNVVTENPEAADRLRLRIAEAFRDAAAAEVAELGEDELQRLQSLGYLQDSDASMLDPSSSPTGPDPKDMIPQYLQLQLAAGEMIEGRYAAAEKHLLRLAASDPGNVMVRCRLADARIAQENWDGARQALREAMAVARDRGRAPVIWRLAGLERRLGNYDRALSYYREHDALTSPSGRTVEQMADTMLEAGRSTESEALLREWLTERPGSLHGLRPLARLLDAAGRTSEAREVWGRILESRPRDPQARRALGLSDDSP